MSRDFNNGFEEWGGYMDAKITKLEEQFSAASHPFRQTNLFAGISIFVNGRTDPSADELKRLMMVHGGTFHHYERSHTTYIIASNLPDVKVRNMNTSKIIRAQWVVDCLKEQRLVDYTRYLLYTNQRNSQPSLASLLKKQQKTEELQNASARESEVSLLTEKLPMLESKESLLTEKLPVFNGTINPSALESEVSLQTEKLPVLNGTMNPSALESEVSLLTEEPPMLNGDAPDNKSSITAETNPRLEQTEVNLGKKESVEDVNCTKPQNNTNAAVNASTSGVARTAVDPNFLAEFYNNSRLHHIATLGSEFKQYINELRQRHGDAGFPCRQVLREKLLSYGATNSIYKRNGYVMHIDMDCFFVSVGLRKHPHLRGLPVAVTHSKGSNVAHVPVHPNADRQLEKELLAARFEQHLHNNILSDKVRQGFDSKMSLAEIASCSYEAREKGVRNGMFVGQAMQLCPDLKTIPYDFEAYREVAFTLYDIIAQYTLNIEAVSCDEMFVDLSELLDEIKFPPMTFVEAIRHEVLMKTDCPCSAGVGRNKLQARMATKQAKPCGQYHLKEYLVEAYMADIPIIEIPGVGSSTAHFLEKVKLRTCRDLQKVSLAKLQTLVGKKLGNTMYHFCRGNDNRPLVYCQIRKSVSAEVNYGIRFSEYTELETFLRQLCTEVHKRLTNIKRRTKHITLKLMVRSKDAPVEASKYMGHGVCDQMSKSVLLSSFTDDLELITRTVLTTMKAMALPPNELRGIGIQLNKLEDPNEPKEKKENMIKAMFTKIAENKTQKESSSESEGIALLKQDFNTDTNNSMPVGENMSYSTEKTKAESKQTTKRLRSRDAKEPKKRANSILQMIKNAAMRQRNEPVIGPITFGSQCPPNVDPTVFAELPSEIRAEILRDYASIDTPNQSTKCETKYGLNDSDIYPSTSKAAKERLEGGSKPKDSSDQKFNGVDEEFLQALPPDIRAEVEMQLNEEQLKLEPGAVGGNDEDSSNTPDVLQNISKDNIFAQSKCSELLLEWVESCDRPEPYDVGLICTHAREFVRNKCIDRLYDPLNYLCRVVNAHAYDCCWHVAYNQIVKAVQREMRTAYEGKILFLHIKLNCKECHVV